jgi:hypothetical protein
LQLAAKKSLYNTTNRIKRTYAQVVRQAETTRQWRMAPKQQSEEGRAKVRESQNKYTASEKGQLAAKRGLERKKTDHSKEVAKAAYERRKLVGFFTYRQDKKQWVRGTGPNPQPDPSL